MAKEVAKADASQKALAANALEMFGDRANAGLENVTAADLLIPRLGILQGLSPQVMPSKPEYIKGSVVGQICDIGMSELFEGAVEFLPVYFVKQWLEWAPRASGKGLQNVHETNDILDKTERDEKNRPILPNGNLIAETAQFFGLNLSAGGRQSFLPMASTQLKKSRKWLSLATSEKLTRPDGTEFTPDLFYRSYTLSTVPESNNEGDWIGWKIERSKALPELDDFRKIYDRALEFQASLVSGKAKGDLASMAEDVETASAGSSETAAM